MKRTLLIALLATAVTSSAQGQTRGNRTYDKGKTQEVTQVDKERVQAMLRGDTMTLSRILSDDLIYTHSSGRVETKQQFIDSIKSGALTYELFETDDVQVRTYREMAVVTGQANVKVRSRGQANSFRIRFIAVYVKQSGRWQFVAWQSTRIAQP